MKHEKKTGRDHPAEKNVGGDSISGICGEDGVSVWLRLFSFLAWKRHRRR